jgi:hypothetical protein
MVSQKNRARLVPGVQEKKWSGRLDLNQRPHAPQACALPGCATSRLSSNSFSLSPAFEEGQDCAQLLAQIVESL